MITITLCITGWLIGWVLIGRPRRLADLRTRRGALAGSATGDPLRCFDVIIPARDEGDVIGLLLGDLAPLTGSGTRVLVVDDHSSDRTAQVAASFQGVRVLTAPELPDGWTGKSWACHSGVSALLDDLVEPSETSVEGTAAGSAAVGAPRGLVFLDADVRFHSGAEALELLMRRQQDRGGLVSVQPWHHTVRPYERLSAIFNVLAIMGAAPASRRGPTGAFGPVLVTSMDAYRASGGHAAVRAEVTEDLALAERFRAAGFEVELFEGAQDIQFRMYPDGPAQLIEGWTKNFSSGAGATRPVRLLGAVLWITGMGSGAVAVVDGLRNELPLWIGIALYLAFVVQLVVMFRRVGRFGLTAALVYPALLVFFLAVFLRSVWQSRVRHSVRWRGRAIPVGVKQVGSP